jgi:hypothetical protein
VENGIRKKILFSRMIRFLIEKNSDIRGAKTRILSLMTSLKKNRVLLDKLATDYPFICAPDIRLLALT